MSNFLWTELQQSQHPFHHQRRMDRNDFLVDSYDVGQERKGFDLGSDEVDKHFFVEQIGMPNKELYNKNFNHPNIQGRY